MQFTNAQSIIAIEPLKQIGLDLRRRAIRGDKPDALKPRLFDAVEPVEKGFERSSRPIIVGLSVQVPGYNIHGHGKPSCSPCIVSPVGAGQKSAGLASLDRCGSLFFARAD
jgi:hypothetical protein